MMLFLACQGPVTLLLDDANNYAFTSEITADATVVPARADSRVDWSALTTDFLGEPVTAVDGVDLAWFQDETEEAVLQSFNDGVPPEENAFLVQYAPGGTSAMMSEFAFNGTFIDIGTQVLPDRGTYLVAANTADRPRMFQLFRPTDGAPEATVRITDDSAHIAFDVDLSHGTALSLPGGTNEITLDWAGLTTNGSGRPIRLPNVDRLVLAEFDESLEELEADFLHFDALAEQRFEIDVAGFGSAILTRASGDAGDTDATDADAFTGFDDGNWFVALLCTTCLNPAPPFLARVEVE